MKIEILGTGCPKCRKLFQNTEEAVRDLKLDAEVVKVEDIIKSERDYLDTVYLFLSLSDALKKYEMWKLFNF